MAVLRADQRLRVYALPVATNATEHLLKALAYLSGMNSTVASGVYTIMWAPTFSPAAGTYTSVQSVTISTPVSGATIRYTTDGSAPSQTNGIVYSGAVTISQCSTLKAIAYITGVCQSTVATATYTMQCAMPTFSMPSSIYTTPPRTVAISTTTPGATIRYTTDGTAAPSVATERNIYNNPLLISSCLTLKAIAYKTGLVDSTVNSRGVYDIMCAAPSYNPPHGTFGLTQYVTMTTATAGATICYTADGSTPDKESRAGTIYTGPVTVSTTTTLKSIAYMSGLLDSNVTTHGFIIVGANGQGDWWVSA